MKERREERLTALSPPPEPLRNAAHSPPEATSFPSQWSRLCLNTFSFTKLIRYLQKHTLFTPGLSFLLLSRSLFSNSLIQFLTVSRRKRLKEAWQTKAENHPSKDTQEREELTAAAPVSRLGERERGKDRSISCDACPPCPGPPCSSTPATAQNQHHKAHSRGKWMAAASGVVFH